MKKLFVDLSSINAASDKLCLIYQQNGLPVEYDATEHDQQEYETEYKSINNQDYL